MVNFSIVTSWLAIIGIIVGMLSPGRSLCWYPGRRTRGNVFRFYGLLLLLSFLLFALTAEV